MAHDIYRDSMVYAGQVPWHGIGKQLPQNATWEEVYRLAGFYRVRREEIFLANGKVIEGKRAIVRESDSQALSVVSDTYCPIQFDAVAQTIVEAAQGVGAIFHTAGLLGEAGAKGWMLAELPKVLRVKGDESEIRPYLLGYAGHDAQTGVTIRNVATRVVCANTLGVALSEDKNFSVTIKHTAGADERLKLAQRAFSALITGMDEFEKLANMLAGTPFSDRQMQRTVDDLLPVRLGEEAGKSLGERRDRVLSLFQGEALGMSGIRGTAWGAFQAWSEFNDHHRAVRNDPSGVKRLESIWMGRSADLKADALKSIMGQVRQAA